MRVNDVALPFARDAHQHRGVAHDRDRIVAGHVERNEFAAGRGDVGGETSGTRDDDGTMAGAG